jgi:hypothetical protein
MDSVSSQESDKFNSRKGMTMDARMITQGTSPEGTNPEDAESLVRKPTIEMRVPVLERLSIIPLLNDDDHSIIENDPTFFERETVRDVSVMLRDDPNEPEGIELLDVDPDPDDDDDFWRTPALPSNVRPTLLTALDSPFSI